MQTRKKAYFLCFSYEKYKKLVNDKNGVVTEISAESLADGIIRLMSDEQLYKNIADYLKNNDNSDEENKFKEQWRNLLEE